MDQIINLLQSVPRAAALIDKDQQILDCNEKFVKLAFDGKNRNAPDWLAEGQHKTRLTSLLDTDKTGWRGSEIILKLKNKSTLCWCENHTLIISHQGANDDKVKKTLVHFFEFQDVEKYRTLEAAYLHQLRRVVDDNLWILNEEGILLWVRADNENYENFKGHYGDVLIVPEDRNLWREVLINAKKNPGKTFEVQVRADSDGGARYIDLCYLSSLFGGRYYVASRSTTPTGSRIILRLKEAWGVASDTDLAKKLSTSGSSISRANDAETVPPNWLVHTGQMTGFSLDWLFTGQGDKRRI